MKKTILLFAAVCAAFTMTAQIAKVSAPEPILKGVESNLFHPVLSADGNQLLVSDADYSNLRTYDFKSGAVKKLNADKNAAFKAHFGKNNVVELQEPASVRTDHSTLYVKVKGVEKAYQPVPSYAGYLWASLSPDGTKVMFVAAGHGIVIIDLEGNIIAEPGKYEAPVWFGNDHIIVQNTTDDGHQFTSSQILLMNADGSEKQALTRPESMTFSPTASFDAEKVVYTTVDGRLYQLNVELNK